MPNADIHFPSLPAVDLRKGATLIVSGDSGASADTKRRISGVQEETGARGF